MYWGMRAIIDGSSNNLLFITYLPNNIDVFNLNTFQIINHDSLLANDRIQHHCFVLKPKNGSKSTKKKIKMLSFCKNTVMSITKAIATYCTYPLQVMKTMLQKKNTKFKNMIDCGYFLFQFIFYLISMEGYIEALYSGLNAKLFQTVLNSTIKFVIYKHLLVIFQQIVLKLKAKATFQQITKIEKRQKKIKHLFLFLLSFTSEMLYIIKWKKKNMLKKKKRLTKKKS
ncbi:hypothetical protein RFI_25817 [Reticulomyxa filosa]|uniref:Uncharacterized protein n=1 Tax=Reticulomyxa filosa TaxID=46433 RepID=X6MES5_RETFI|nr:hypothetical protein RFI_25817 [Reticulomyxa filosa]|eukprot:ETO11560.1 hypothetical protein RFI_25817 [Reticulomyxa filosa]